MKENFETLRRIEELFFGRKTGLYAQQKFGAEQGRMIFYPALQLTLDLIQAHIDGQQTLGTPLIGDDGCCRFVVYDSDDDFGALAKQEQYLLAHGLACYRESQSEKRQREGHTFLFIDPPIASEIAYDFVQLTALAAGNKLKTNSFDRPGALEAFPKQSKNRNGPGSCIRVPYGIKFQAG